MLTVGSLFSGIGGLDLGLERAGMKVIWQSEIDPYACKVLSKHWPEVVNHGDIKSIQWGNIVRPDIICGGYPCQPFSTAGKRQGEEDSRHLWPWVREAISELRPRYAILENVRGHLSMGGLSVIGDLATIGYDAEWRIVSAASVGANHKRERVIIVAYPQSNWQRREHSQNTKTLYQWYEIQKSLRGSSSAIPNNERIGNGQHRITTEAAKTSKQWVFDGRRKEGYDGWQWWATEPDVGRVAHGIPSRVDRLRGLGNAVVPQVAEVIGRLVMEHAS